MMNNENDVGRVRGKVGVVRKRFALESERARERGRGAGRCGSRQHDRSDIKSPDDDIPFLHSALLIGQHGENLAAVWLPYNGRLASLLVPI